MLPTNLIEPLSSYIGMLIWCAGVPYDKLSNVDITSNGGDVQSESTLSDSIKIKKNESRSVLLTRTIISFSQFRSVVARFGPLDRSFVGNLYHNIVSPETGLVHDWFFGVCLNLESRLKGAPQGTFAMRMAPRGNRNALELCIANKLRKVDKGGLQKDAVACRRLVIRRNMTNPHRGRFILQNTNGEAHFADRLSDYIYTITGKMSPMLGTNKQPPITMCSNLKDLFKISVAPWAIALAQRFMANPFSFYSDIRAREIDALKDTESKTIDNLKIRK
jgi:hypothetical protein